MRPGHKVKKEWDWHRHAIRTRAFSVTSTSRISLYCVFFSVQVQRILPRSTCVALFAVVLVSALLILFSSQCSLIEFYFGWCCGMRFCLSMFVLLIVLHPVLFLG